MTVPVRGPVPDQHLGTRCARMIDKPGSMLAYPCTLPQGHAGKPVDDPEPCYAVEVPKAVNDWQAWRLRMDARKTPTGPRAMIDTDLGPIPDETTEGLPPEQEEVMSSLGTAADLDDARDVPVDPNGPHEHEYENGRCKHCDNPGDDWTAATLTEGERAWMAGSQAVAESLADLGEAVAKGAAARGNEPGDLTADFDGEKRNPEHWARLEGIRIADPDGWRGSARLPIKDFEEPIDYDEWVARRNVSTIESLPGVKRRLIHQQVTPTGDSSKVDVQTLVITDLIARREHGVVKYGQALRTFNGRLTIRDLYEELLDAATYARSLMAVAETRRSELIEAVVDGWMVTHPAWERSDAHSLAAIAVDRILDAVVMIEEEAGSGPAE